MVVLVGGMRYIPHLLCSTDVLLMLRCTLGLKGACSRLGRRAAGSFTARESASALSEALLQRSVAAVVAKADDLVTVTGLPTAKLGSIIQLKPTRTRPPVMALVVALPKEHTVAALLHRHADVREGNQQSNLALLIVYLFTLTYYYFFLSNVPAHFLRLIC